MRKLDARFYWDTAKFCFALMGGGTAGFYAARGLNAVTNKLATMAELSVASKMMNRGSDEESGLDLSGDDELKV